VIEKQKTAAEQFWYAMESGTESAWKSVAQYFPSDQEYTPRAKQQLARLFLQSNRNKEALDLFQQFVRNPQGDPKYKAFGFAGECLAYYSMSTAKDTPNELRDEYQKDIAKAAGALVKLRDSGPPDKRGTLLDRQMARLVSDVLKATNNSAESAEFDKWRADHFPDDSTATQN
jgi:hypothetical protein